MIPGEIGFLTLEYRGRADRARIWHGAVTASAYVFGGEERIKLVDLRDALRLLAPRLTAGAAPVFVLWRDHARSDPGS